MSMITLGFEIVVVVVGVGVAVVGPVVVDRRTGLTGTVAGSGAGS
jgi:hypothetical protein